MKLRLPSVPVLDFIVGLPILLLVALAYVIWLVAHFIWNKALEGPWPTWNSLRTPKSSM